MSIFKGIPEVSAALAPPNSETALPAAPAAPSAPVPRGRPWVQGQSGNPAGRPRRARQAAVGYETLLQRQKGALHAKALEMALAGDHVMLRDALDRISPRRREPPVDLDLPAIANRQDLRAAMRAVADAAGAGRLTAAQADTLVRMLRGVLAAN